MHRAVGWATAAPQAESRVLALACAVSAMVCGYLVAVPFSPTAPTPMVLGLGLLATVIAVTLWWLRGRTPAVVLHAVVVLATMLVSWSVAVATTPAGAAVTAFGYLWVATYTAWFHQQSAFTGHLALMGVGLAAALAVGEAVSPVQTWVFVAASVGVVAVVLHRLVARLRDLAHRDPLTGLLNRVAFTDAAERAIALAARDGRPLTVALIDLDDFKRVNDEQGHLAGDELLAELARRWQAGVRRSDVLARFGGDEFVLLMPATAEPDAAEPLQRLDSPGCPARWTIGVAQWEGDSLAAWLARADADLYRRKATLPR